MATWVMKLFILNSDFISGLVGLVIPLVVCESSMSPKAGSEIFPNLMFNKVII